MSEETLTNETSGDIEAETIIEEKVKLELEDDLTLESEEIDHVDDPGEVSLEEQLALAEAQAADYLEGWQRARAEFANARKRLERQRTEAYSNAAVDYAKKLLPVLDDFDRALHNVPPEVEEDNWFEGLLLVQRKLNSILEELEVERIEALGEPFDPNIHEALTLKEADGVESGLIVEEIQTGYRLGNKVIRPSLVNVAA